ncbi:MAG: hypothetical protein HYV33_03725 [Candidatus Kerfeldbacteria bacterium]|nr:hypothetical protein [Candidatus Kerfeldbacteria bacterium]
MKFINFSQVERYLQRQDQHRDDYYQLQRMQTAVNRLQHPELRYQVIQVGGTSGKGSTCAMIAAIVQQASWRVGLYSSPALPTTLHRIMVNQRPVAAGTVVRLMNTIQSRLTTCHLTSFEWWTILAFQYFAEQQVDYAIVEVGVGGRYDATTVVQPTVAIVTDIGLDHTEILGKTKTAIAQHKAAIIKPGVVGFTGSRLVKRGRYVNLNGASIHHASLRGTTFSYKQWHHITLGVPGVFQVRNAILALTVANHLSIPVTVVRRALAHLTLPARFQILQRQPLIIADGAHNPQKMAAFIDSFQQLVPRKLDQRVIVLLSIKYTKDLYHTLQPIMAVADEVIITAFSDSAPLGDIKTVLQQFKPTLPIQLMPNSQQAYQQLQHRLTRRDVGVITGSLYLLADLYSVIY